jgi:hypothetical protein
MMVYVWQEMEVQIFTLALLLKGTETTFFSEIFLFH